MTIRKSSCTELRSTLNSDIDGDMCRTQTMLYELDFMPDAARRSSLEKQIIELCKEKRYQKLSHWQDTVMLKHELRKAEKELRTATLDLWMIRFLS